MAIGIGTALLGSALIGGIGSALSSGSESKAIRTGMESSERISGRDMALQRDLAEMRREDFAPWRDTGVVALEKIKHGIENDQFDPAKFNDPDYAVKWNEPEFNVKYEAPQFTGTFEAPEFQMQDPRDDPSYDFRKQEGVDALDASAAGGRNILSGKHRKDLVRFGQDYSSNEFAKAYGRSADQYGRDYQAKLDEYGAEVDQYGRDVNASQNAYARGMNKYNLDYNKSVDQYGREVGERDRKRDIAMDTYNRDLDAKNRKFNILTGLSSGGRAAAAGQSGATGDLARSSSNILQNLSGAKRTGYNAIGRSKSDMYGGVAQSANQGIENWLTYKGMQ